MKLFMKDHGMLIGFEIVQFAFVILILWLDGYRDMQTVFYIIFLSFFLFGCFLVYRYIAHRPLYKRLQKPFASLDESLVQTTGRTAFAKALNDLLHSQYRLYLQNISETETQKEEHFTFIDRWVHQMKTPLSVIDLTAQDIDEPESSSIREETGELKNGLQTVLYMARLRTIEQDFRIRPIRLSACIHHVNQDNKRYFIRNEVYPRLLQKEEDLTVESDEKWLSFMLTQLIQNAVKYSSGISKNILISIYSRDGAAILEVQDHGVGIPEEDRKRIFHAFYTGKNGRLYRESTGMGLYLVKEVAAYLGHSLEMESTVDRGTTFRIVFPPAQNIT